MEYSQKFSVQFQFLCTRQPPYLKLHINYQLRAPRVILFFFPSLSPLSLSSPNPSSAPSVGAQIPHLLPPAAADLAQAAAAGNATG
jgi:hypothetical protein